MNFVFPDECLGLSSMKRAVRKTRARDKTTILGDKSTVFVMNVSRPSPLLNDLQLFRANALREKFPISSRLIYIAQ